MTEIVYIDPKVAKAKGFSHITMPVESNETLDAASKEKEEEMDFAKFRERLVREEWERAQFEAGLKASMESMNLMMDMNYYYR